MAGVAAAPPQVEQKLLHSGNFPERAIGNLGSFSDFALNIRAILPLIYGYPKRGLLMVRNPFRIGVPKHGTAYLPNVNKR